MSKREQFERHMRTFLEGSKEWADQLRAIKRDHGPGAALSFILYGTLPPDMDEPDESESEEGDYLPL